MADRPKPAAVEDYDDEAEEPVHNTRHSATIPRNDRGSHERSDARKKQTSRRIGREPRAYATGAVATGSNTPKTKPPVKQRQPLDPEPRSTEKLGRRPSKDPRSAPHRRMSVENDTAELYGAPSPDRRSIVTQSQTQTQPFDIPFRQKNSYASNYGSAQVDGYYPPLSASSPYNMPPPLYASPATQQPFALENYAPAAREAGYFPPVPAAPTRPLAERFTLGPRVEIQRTNSSASMRGIGLPSPRVQRTIAGGRMYYDDLSDGYASEAASIRQPSSYRRESTIEGGRMEQYAQHAREMPPPPLPFPPRPILARRPATEMPRSYTPDSIGGPMYMEEGHGSWRSYIQPESSRPEYRHSVSQDHVAREPRSRAYERTVYGDSRSRSREYSPEPAKEKANSRRRRQTYIGEHRSNNSSEFEEKIDKVLSYQKSVEDIGVERPSLTAEALKRQKRTAGSSRSTRSSASRDESDFKRSMTTRTTRSGGNDAENVTIKVSGMTSVHVVGARIDCPDGGEIEIKRPQSVRGGGSEQSSNYGGRFIGGQSVRSDDRRSDDPHRQKLGRLESSGRDRNRRSSIAGSGSMRRNDREDHF